MFWVIKKPNIMFGFLSNLWLFVFGFYIGLLSLAENILLSYFNANIPSIVSLIGEPLILSIVSLFTLSGEI